MPDAVKLLHPSEPLCNILERAGVEFEVWPKDDPKPLYGNKKYVYESPETGKMVYLFVAYYPEPGNKSRTEARFELHAQDFEWPIICQVMYL